MLYILKDILFSILDLLKYWFYGAWREKLRPSYYLWMNDGSEKTKKEDNK